MREIDNLQFKLFYNKNNGLSGRLHVSVIENDLHKEVSLSPDLTPYKAQLRTFFKALLADLETQEGALLAEEEEEVIPE